MCCNILIGETHERSNIIICKLWRFFHKFRHLLSYSPFNKKEKVILLSHHRISKRIPDKNRCFRHRYAYYALSDALLSMHLQLLFKNSSFCLVFRVFKRFSS